MASTTEHVLPSLGSKIATGTASVADGEAVTTGLTTVSGFVATAQVTDCVVSNRSSSGGSVTVGVFVAGTASASARTISWFAWSNQKI